MKFSEILGVKSISKDEFFKVYKQEAKSSFLKVEKIKFLFNNIYVLYSDPFGLKYLGVLENDSVFTCFGGRV